MTGRLSWLAILMGFAVLATACGGNADTDDISGDSESPTEQDDQSTDEEDTNGGESSSDDTSDQTAGDGAPEFDPGTMPPAGEVVAEIDGQTFTIVADDMDYFTCDVGEDFVNVRTESETQSLAVQFDPGLGLGNANLTIEDSNVRYDSFFGPETTGGASVEAPHVLYEGRFDASKLDDPADVTDAGIGQVAVTCP